MSLKLSNLIILSGFAPGPKFVGKKNVWNLNSDKFLRRFISADRQQVLPLIVSKSDLPLSVHSDDSTIFTAT